MSSVDKIVQAGEVISSADVLCFIYIMDDEGNVKLIPFLRSKL